MIPWPLLESTRQPPNSATAPVSTERAQDSVAGYQPLDRLAGAIRFVWNYLLSENNEQYAEAKAHCTRKPRTSARQFTRSALLNDPEFAWLQDH